jgi:hypothetical protein
VFIAFQPNAFQSSAFQIGYASVGPAVIRVGGDDAKKKKIPRREIREAIIRAFDGPAKDEARELLIPFSKFAEVRVEEIDFGKLERDLDTVRRIIELVSFDDDDEDFLLLM